MKALKYFLFTLLIATNIVLGQTVYTIAQAPGQINDGLELDAQGNIYCAVYGGTQVTKITPSGEVSIFASGFQSPNGIVFGPDGYLYVPNPPANRIDRVSPTGEVSNYIPSIPTPSELYFDKTGLLYVTDYNSNKIYTVDSTKKITTLYSGGSLNGPIGILHDSKGVLYIGNFTDGRVFRIDSNNVFTKIGDLPKELGFMILIDDQIFATCYSDHRIYQIPTDGSGQKVFAGTGQRGFIDGPVSTAKFNLPNGIIATPSGDTIYVSDYGTGAIRRITGVRAALANESFDDLLFSPNDFALQQNFPNPFNPSTTIEYNLPNEGFVDLRVFSVLGEEVATLVNEVKQAGVHTASFDAGSLPSGMYVYSLKSGSFSQSKKMILMK